MSTSICTDKPRQHGQDPSAYGTTRTRPVSIRYNSRTRPVRNLITLPARRSARTRPVSMRLTSDKTRQHTVHFTPLPVSNLITLSATEDATRQHTVHKRTSAVSMRYKQGRDRRGPAGRRRRRCCRGWKGSRGGSSRPSRPSRGSCTVSRSARC